MPQFGPHGKTTDATTVTGPRTHIVSGHAAEKQFVVVFISGHAAAEKVKLTWPAFVGPKALMAYSGLFLKRGEWCQKPWGS